MMMDRKTFAARRSPRSKNGEYVTDEEKLIYLERLMKPYQKAGRHHFITQYLEADGNELSKKFWSIRSSSRFAFELYSWMAEQADVKSLFFEYKLVGIKGSPKKPNMDVYIEKGDSAIFIESKFAESYSQSSFSMPDAYWKKEGAISADGTKDLRSTLGERYYGLTDVANRFSAFIQKAEELLKAAKKEDRCWMDFEQEIKHLIGIALTLIASKTQYRDKDIKFYNVYYDFGDPIYPYVHDFFSLAEKMMNELLVDAGYCKSFEYGHISAQKLAQSTKVAEFDPHAKAFGSEKEIHEILWEQYFFDPWGINTQS